MPDDVRLLCGEIKRLRYTYGDGEPKGAKLTATKTLADWSGAYRWLDAVAAAPADYVDIGGAPPTPAAIDAARHLSHVLKYRGWEPPAILCAGGNGDIIFEFAAKPPVRLRSFEVNADGAVEWVAIGGGGATSWRKMSGGR